MHCERAQPALFYFIFRPSTCPREELVNHVPAVMIRQADIADVRFSVRWTFGGPTNPISRLASRIGFSVITSNGSGN
jgi:hypothetical protein